MVSPALRRRARLREGSHFAYRSKGGHRPRCFLLPGTPETLLWSQIPDTPFTPWAPCSRAARATCCRSPRRTVGCPISNSIPDDVAGKAKLLWLNYPNNPTGAVADLEYYRKAIQFAENHDIAVMHDACYTEVAYDGYRPPSFLQAEGAMDVGIEFHSLSKSYNMTGWRIGMAVGNADMIDALLTIKSNLDSGVPQAVQHMAIEAMKRPLESVDERNVVYQARRDRIVPVLKDMGMRGRVAEGRSVHLGGRSRRLYLSRVRRKALGGHRCPDDSGRQLRGGGRRVRPPVDHSSGRSDR